MHFKILRKCFDKGKDGIKIANVLEGKLVTSDYTRPELIFWLNDKLTNSYGRELYQIIQHT